MDASVDDKERLFVIASFALRAFQDHRLTGAETSVKASQFINSGGQRSSVRNQ